MSGMFKVLENEMAIIRVAGVFKEAQVAERDGELYARYNGGWIRLNADGTTSVGSKDMLDTLTIEAQLYKSRMGRLRVAAAKGAKPIELCDNGALMIEGDQGA